MQTLSLTPGLLSPNLNVNKTPRQCAGSELPRHMNAPESCVKPAPLESSLSAGRSGHRRRAWGELSPTTVNAHAGHTSSKGAWICATGSSGACGSLEGAYFRGSGPDSAQHQPAAASGGFGACAAPSRLFLINPGIQISCEIS